MYTVTLTREHIHTNCGENAHNYTHSSPIIMQITVAVSNRIFLLNKSQQLTAACISLWHALNTFKISNESTEFYNSLQR